MKTPVFILATLVASNACNAPSAPNVILVIVDDLGWADTGVYGSTFYETPHIDRLAREGVRFTNFYTASPVCSPTRASLMTGQHPARVHITNWIGGEQQGQLRQAEYERELALDYTTVGETFADAGYATAYVGKWHLGGDGFAPDDQGFAINIGGHAAGQPGSYFHPYTNDRLPWSNVPHLEKGDEGEYLTDRLTDESLTFIRENRDRPFLRVLSHYAVHTPLQSKADLTARYENKRETLPVATEPAFTSERGWGTTKGRQDHAVYAGMIHSTDESIGRILAELDDARLTERTMVVFVSDNGGLSTLSGEGQTAPTSNRPLRAGKGWLYEGGIRAPLIVRWPRAIPAGRTVDTPTISTDLVATLLDLADLPLPPDVLRDGHSLQPVIAGRDIPDRDALFWHFPHYHGSGNRPSGAVRRGDYKLIEWFEDGTLELYDLKNDVGETRNMADQSPDIVRELHGMLVEWREAVGARMPTANPDWKGGS